MSTAALRVEVSQQGRTALVQVTGELDIATAPLLAARFADLLAPGAGEPVDRVVVDLSGLAFADLVGLGALLDAERRLRERGGTIALRAPSGLVRRVLTVLRLDQRLPVELPAPGDGGGR